VALGVWLVLFTSFFSNASGPLDSIRTYAPWLRRAEGGSPHIHSWTYYLGLLAYQRVGRGPTWSEGLILGLALVGFVAALARGRDVGGVGGWVQFVAFYTMLLTVIYSVIPYKTPWCLLGFLHGLILLAGVGAAWIVARARRWPMRVAPALVVLLGAGQLTAQAYRASYTYCDNPRNPYVYAHTLSSVLSLVDRVEGLARVDPRGDQLLIKVMAKGGDYWPLPWYLRRFEQVGWWDAVAEDPIAPIVIASPAFAPQLEQVLGGTHQMAGYFGLRPAVFLQLYVERGLWERYLAHDAIALGGAFD
jgi:predicted membrane-bound mannosyltransferase